MAKYAAETSVSSDRSRAELEKTLARYGAEGFFYGWRQTNALVAFEMHDRRIQFKLPMPEKREFSRTPTGRIRTIKQSEEAYEQAIRQKWRALLLVVKAKLEAVESGITTFEEEFLAHIVLPNGQTYGDFAIPQVALAYRSGTMPPMLPGGKD